MLSKFLKTLSDDYCLQMSAEMLRNEEVHSGHFFQDESCLAVESREGKKVITAIGRNARSLEGAPEVEIINPFEGRIGQLDQLDVIVALINHSTYEIASGLKQKAIAPTLTLISDEEIFFKPDIDKVIMQRCGFRKVTIVTEA